MKILLLNVNSYSFFYGQLVIPFGLASLGSYVEGDDYTIKGIDMNTPPERIPLRYLHLDEELLKEIVEYSPDLVAVSSYASNMHNILFWAEAIKRALPKTCIVVGGNHASYIAREVLEKCPAIDIVVRFEGEIPFKMICEHIEEGSRNYFDIPNITYIKGKKVAENTQIELIKTLDLLPPLNRRYFEDDEDKQKVTHIDMITARGCPFHCTFCDCNHYWGKTYRTQDVETVIDELKHLCREYPNLKTVRFRDESITINKARCIALCEGIISNNLNTLKFQAHSRLDGLNEEVVKHLAEAGFEQLFIGFESGSQAVLKRLKKGIDISKADVTIRLLKQYGVKPRISFLIATRNETFRESMETVKLIKKLKLNRDEFYIGSSIQIYPGTYEHKKFLEENPDYEWTTKKPHFRGKYFGDKDPYGNVIQPSFREYGGFKVFLVYLMVGFGFAVQAFGRLFAGMVYKNRWGFSKLGAMGTKVVVKMDDVKEKKRCKSIR